MSAALLPIFSIRKALGQTGLAARAMVYLSIAVLLFMGAFLSSEAADGAAPKDVFSGVETWPFGEFILLAFGALLLCYTGFRGLQALTEEQDPEWSARLARLGMVSSGFSYGLIGYTSIVTAIGNVSRQDSEQTKTVIATLLAQPFGRWVIIALGLMCVMIAAVQVYRAVTERWKRNLDLGEVPNVFVKLSAFAIFGRGLLILIVGISVIWAGLEADPSEAMGITSSLSWLRSAPFGFALYVLSGVVMLGYGVYGLMQTLTYKFSG